jgi:multicomponent Na+:H+ antiporter subunit F
LRGPSLPDRVLAIDLITSVVAGAFVVFSVLWKAPELHFLILIWMFVTFLSTVGFAFYLQEKGKGSHV